MDNLGLIMKDVIKYGLLVGIPLAIIAYLYLTVVGNQLGAQAFANDADTKYAQRADNERLRVVPTNEIHLGTVDFIDSDRDTLIPAYGYRHYQPTYDPSLAEYVSFNGVRVVYDGVTL